MNELQIFNNPEFGQIRTVTIDGEPWFVGKDVAIALGYTNSRKALSDHVEEEDKGVTKCDTLGGRQELAIINESGLYSLIFGSKLESAKRFKHWVTSEVLPALRKTGHYEMPGNPEKAYPPKASSLSEVGSFMRMVWEVMEKQGCPATEVAVVMKETCVQFGITLPDLFVRPEMGFASFAEIYHRETGRKATYRDYTAYKSAFGRKRRK